MTSETLPAFQRRAFTKDAGDGKSCAEWTLTPTGLTDAVQIIAEPIATLPIIFVPGIMGSNLMLTMDAMGKSKGEAVWLMNGAVGAAWHWVGVDAASRQVLLNPATTAVFGGGNVPSEVASIGNADAIRQKRFWGEVSAMSYGDFLVWLQRTMNHAGRVGKWRAELGLSSLAAHLASGMTFKPLTETDVSHAAYFRYPVYACGYNWLRSNRDAADTLATRIDAVIAANNSSSYRCEKVILVTHSMGGLVARACSELAGMRHKIAGIVHGVMPANGAAVAYKRVRTGTEGSAGLVIGDAAEKVTAVFANSPGALQLLPNIQYGTGWLKLGMASRGSFRTIVELPKSDPYQEIYRQRGPWWALVREEMINPGKVNGHKGWPDYIKNINIAAEFHTQLAQSYHPNTYTFHGDGRNVENGLTWGNVGWYGTVGNRKFDPCAADLLASRLLADNGHGKVEIAVQGSLRPSMYVGSKDASGDGTVPLHSGNAPALAGVQATYRLDLGSQGHEGSYRVELAQRVTLHSVINIAQKVNVLT